MHNDPFVLGVVLVAVVTNDKLNGGPFGVFLKFGKSREYDVKRVVRKLLVHTNRVHCLTRKLCITTKMGTHIRKYVVIIATLLDFRIGENRY